MNGKEKDDEGMGGGGATYDYGFRIYNPAIGKFLSVDPLTKSYPWYTPYQFAGNKPISCSDLDGAEEDLRIFATKVFGNTTELFVFDYKNVTMEDYQNLAIMMGMGAEEGATLFWMISGNNKANVELVVTDGVVTGYRATKMAEKVLPEVIISGDNQPVSGDIQPLYAKLERNLTGSWDNYGDLEHFVKAGKFGSKGKIARNAGVIGYDLCFYASSENSGGIALELYTEETLNRTAGSDLNTETIASKLECELYFQASTGGLSSEWKDGGIFTTTKTVVVNKYSNTVAGVNLSMETETDLGTKKTKVNTQVSIGKGSSPGVKGEIKQRQSLILASGEKNLKGQ